MQFGQQLAQNKFDGISLAASNAPRVSLGAAIAGMTAVFNRTEVPVTDTEMQAKRQAPEEEKAAKMGEMPVGVKWRLAIASDQAYGAAGSPPVILGHAALVFEIHLIAIV